MRVLIWLLYSRRNFTTVDETLRQSTKLYEAVHSIALVDPNVLGKLSSKLKFIAKGMGIQLPFLPVLTKEEKVLFVNLILKTTGGFDAYAMAML
jgi:hypothetical protein